MKSGTVLWSSEGFHINSDTCVDVKASSEGVVLGQLGDAWLHDLHLTPDQSDAIGYALLEGARRAREARL